MIDPPYRRAISGLSAAQRHDDKNDDDEEDFTAADIGAFLHNMGRLL